LALDFGGEFFVRKACFYFPPLAALGGKDGGRGKEPALRRKEVLWRKMIL
jgi:hypothetical protein